MPHNTRLIFNSPMSKYELLDDLKYDPALRKHVLGDSKFDIQGEGRKEFGELLDFVREARFERLGAFCYSEEEGTWGAANLRDSVTPKTKRSRLERLMELQSGISLEFNRSRVGSVEKVIVDSFSDGVLVCRSRYESPEVDGEILVRYEPDAFGGAEPYSLVGDFIEVRITGADEYDLIAEPVSV